MQGTAVALAAVLVLVPAVAAADPGDALDVTFHPPAQIGPVVAANGTQWLLVLFSNSSQARGSVSFPDSTEGVQYNEVQSLSTVPNVTTDAPADAPLPPVPKQYPPMQADLAFGAVGSLFVEAEGIDVQESGLDATLEHEAAGMCATPTVGQQHERERSARFERLCPGESVALRLEAQRLPSFAVRATGIKAVEWHGAAIECHSPSAADCPTGGQRQEDSSGLARIHNVRRLLTFERTAGNGGNLTLSGSAVFLMAGGRSLDLAVEGHARLPLASAPPACSGCMAPDGQTLLATGNFTLHAVSWRPDGTLSGKLAGNLAAVRLDETAIDPATLLGAGAVLAGAAAAVGLALLAKPLLGSLFTKMAPGRALGNASRRRILDHIQQHPGATLRELMRATGLSSKSTQHHVRVLKAAGHLEEQAHGNSRRFFLPGPAPAAERTKAILLRKKPLSDLYELVRRHPWLAQSDILDLAARELGFSRSTTQHRLGRLISGGLVAVRHAGRIKLHAVQEAPTSFRPLTPPVSVIDA
jgi:DNA-binding transcriptional ArsR family regulator